MTSPGPTGPTFAGEPPATPRHRILDTARVLFYRRGVTNVGINEIIAESGVAKATLYAHFATKDELILEFMRQGDARWIAWLDERVRALAPEARARPLAVFDALAEWFALPFFRGCLLGNVGTELADPQHPAQALLADHKERVRALLEGWLAEADAPNPSALASQFLLLIEGATAVARMTRDPNAAQQAQAVARALLGGEKG
ncbi:TetR/AcrR family transcriptional regulator [Deinococcus sp. Arct2-2]|uniref:TetR/AcrR family transcriptional regulator n=1 Tax=Deinococcus sp. Arct2-2 TaxID=2568653 RepID=UPI0010A35339|nr:TetR/AcrR family transcriptional regulator [Deinococcus sp. Arct2-2]THF71621.1 TetR/AcrR family transcriptional regulator [Deinococcus sp. Arct2-2]